MFQDAYTFSDNGQFLVSEDGTLTLTVGSQQIHLSAHRGSVLRAFLDAQPGYVWHLWGNKPVLHPASTLSSLLDKWSIRRVKRQVGVFAWVERSIPRYEEPTLYAGLLPDQSQLLMLPEIVLTHAYKSRLLARLCQRFQMPEEEVILTPDWHELRRESPDGLHDARTEPLWQEVLSVTYWLSSTEIHIPAPDIVERPLSL